MRRTEITWVMAVSLNLSSSSDKAMIDMSQFKKAPPHMMELLCCRHIHQKLFNGILPLMELQRLNPSGLFVT